MVDSFNHSGCSFLLLNPLEHDRHVGPLILQHLSSLQRDTRVLQHDVPESLQRGKHVQRSVRHLCPSQIEGLEILHSCQLRYARVRYLCLVEIEQAEIEGGQMLQSGIRDFRPFKIEAV